MGEGEGQQDEFVLNDEKQHKVMAMEIVSLGDVAKLPVDKSGPADGDFIYIDISSINRETKKIDRVKTIHSSEAPSRARQRLKSGDVLISMTRPNLNAVAIVPESLNGAIGSTGFHVLRTNIVEPKFIYYLVQSKDFIERMCEKVQGALYPAVRPRDIDSYTFNLPSSLELQRRIVAKIEELFSELDKGIESLKITREQLKIYHQALLKHAFEGKLTAQWRKENADKLETSEQLLVRIQQERQARYRQQLEDWEQAVKEWEARSKKGKKPGKPKEFCKQGEPDESSKLKLELPETWLPTCIGHVFSVYVGATPSRKEAAYWNGDIFWVSSGEVSFCEIHETAEKITQLGYENTSTEIHPEGTVLLAMIGEGRTRGQAAILRVPAAHNQNTAAIRVSEINLSPEYFYYFLQYQYEQTRRVGSGNNQTALNKLRVSSIQFPLCAKEEQVEIVRCLEEKLSQVEVVGKELDIQLHKSEALRQSILKKAFSGLLLTRNSGAEQKAEVALLAKS